MKLEVGKYYKDADGNKVGPMRLGVFDGWEYDGSTWYFDINGKSSDGDDPDLIEEWSDEPTLELQAGKYYKTRSGEKRGPCRVNEEGSAMYPWVIPYDSGLFYAYRKDGTSCIDLYEDDIISEWQEEKSYMYHNPDDELTAVWKTKRQEIIEALSEQITNDLIACDYWNASKHMHELKDLEEME